MRLGVHRWAGLGKRSGRRPIARIAGATAEAARARAAGDNKGVGEGGYAGVAGAKHLAQGRNALPAVTRRNAKWHEKIEAMGKNAQASYNRVRPPREAPFCTFRALTV